MAEFSENRDFSTVNLVDRTGRGGTEIIFDGVRIVYPKGVVEKAVPRFVAAWLFRVGQQNVWTEDGVYLCRFGVKDAPEDLVAEIGPEAADISPITVDGSRVEGWDTTGVDRANTRTIELKMPKLNERQGSMAAPFGDRKG